MLNKLIALSGAMLLAVPGLIHAQGSHGNFGGGGGASRAEFSGGSHYGGGGGRGYAYRGGAYRGGYGGYGGHFYGRNYYLGGVGYFYPFFGGFGYPAYAYDGYWNGYAGAPYGYGYGYDGPDGPGGPGGPYEGRVTDQGGPDQQKNGALPEAVQRQLAKRGYYKGSVDGNFGTASRAALSHFQRDKHLKETGRIDEDSLEALGFTDHQ